MSAEKIYGAGDQRCWVNTTTDLRRYTAFHNTFFDGIRWIGRVHAEEKEHRASHGGRSLKQDHFKLMTMSGFLVAQFGWPLFEGHLDQYHRKPERKASAASPQHLTATLLYMAKINVDSYPFKTHIAAQLSPDLSDGVWGTAFSVDKGKINPGFDIAEGEVFDGIGLDNARRDALFRMNVDPLPICLPDRALNEALAEVNESQLKGFKHDDADALSDEEFELVVFPEIRNVVNNLGIHDTPYPIFTGE